MSSTDTDVRARHMFEGIVCGALLMGWLCHVLCSHDDLNPLATNDSESWRIIIYAILMHITLYMNMNWLRHGAATAVPSFRQHVKRDLKRDWFYDANFRNGFAICFFCCKYMQLFWVAFVCYPYAANTCSFSRLQFLKTATELTNIDKWKPNIGTFISSFLCFHCLFWDFQNFV